MGDKPSIAPGDRLYQRLLALNGEEASDIMEEHAQEHSTLDAFDEVALPALRHVEADFRAGVLSEEARSEACQILRQIIAETTVPAPGAEDARVLCIPASHEGDELAALMLAQLLAEAGVTATVLSSKLLAAEALAQAETLAPAIICISSVPPVSTIAARSLSKRLHDRLPSARIIVGLWQAEDADFAVRRERLGKAGAAETYANLRRAVTGLTELAPCTLPPASPEPPVSC